LLGSHKFDLGAILEYISDAPIKIDIASGPVAEAEDLDWWQILVESRKLGLGSCRELVKSQVAFFEHQETLLAGRALAFDPYLQLGHQRLRSLHLAFEIKQQKEKEKKRKEMGIN
jgi:hypothetical protein